MPRNDLEMVKCFDEEGNEIASRTRKDVHTEPYSIWHGVTAIWILNNKNEMLCTKRGDFVESNPGKWQVYAGGHLLSRHSFEENAYIELAEELGLNIPLQLVCMDRKDTAKHIRAIYAARWDGEISELNFDDKEVAEARWLSFEMYEKEFEKTPLIWKNAADKSIYRLVLERLA